MDDSVTLPDPLNALGGLSLLAEGARINKEMSFLAAADECATWWPISFKVLATVCAECGIEVPEDALRKLRAGYRDLYLIETDGEEFLFRVHEPEQREALWKLHESLDSSWRDLAVKAKQAGFDPLMSLPAWAMLKRTLQVMGDEVETLPHAAGPCVRRGKRAVQIVKEGRDA